MIYGKSDKSMNMYQRQPYMPASQSSVPSPYNLGGMYTPPMNLTSSGGQQFAGFQMPMPMYNPMPMGGGKGSPQPPMPMGGGKGGSTPINQPFQTPMGSYSNMGFNPSQF